MAVTVGQQHESADQTPRWAKTAKTGEPSVVLLVPSRAPARHPSLRPQGVRPRHDGRLRRRLACVVLARAWAIPPRADGAGSGRSTPARPSVSFRPCVPSTPRTSARIVGPPFEAGTARRHSPFGRPFEVVLEASRRHSKVPSAFVRAGAVGVCG